MSEGLNIVPNSRVEQFEAGRGVREDWGLVLTVDQGGGEFGFGEVAPLGVADRVVTDLGWILVVLTMVMLRSENTV
jgi:hypothetical protein